MCSALGFNKLCVALNSLNAVSVVPIDEGRDSNQLREMSNVCNVGASGSSASVDIFHNSFRDRSRCRIFEIDTLGGVANNDDNDTKVKLPRRFIRDNLQYSCPHLLLSVLVLSPPTTTSESMLP